MATINKRELTQSLHLQLAEDGLQVKPKVVLAVVNALMDRIRTAVAEGDEVQLIGLGKFYTRTLTARHGRNPSTGEPVEIPERTAPAFKPSKALKRAARGE